MKQSFKVEGLTVNEILSLGDDTLNSLNQRDMSRAVRTAALAANKRINRLLAQAKKTKEGYKLKKSAKYDIALDALNYITKDGKLDPKFGAKGKTRNELYAELARIRTFMNDLKTSTIKGAMQVRKDREIRILGLSKEDYLKEALKEEAKLKKKEKGKKARLTKKEKEALTAKWSNTFRDYDSKAWENFRKFLEMESDLSNKPYIHFYGSEAIIELIGQRTLSDGDEEEMLQAAHNKRQEMYIAQQAYLNDENLDVFHLQF